MVFSGAQGALRRTWGRNETGSDFARVPVKYRLFSLFKNFPIHELLKRQFRCEFFNTLNRPQMGYSGRNNHQF
jgi:hypothetical protein